MSRTFYDVLITREDGWWMVSIPEIDGRTHTTATWPPRWSLPGSGLYRPREDAERGP